MSLGAAFTWLGHAAFHIQVEPDGPGLLIDPWLGNPKVPANAEALASAAKLILLTHAHDDHITGVPDLAIRTRATIITGYELAPEMIAMGVPASQVVGANFGGSFSAHGINVTLVQAVHSSSIDAADGRRRAVGQAGGFIIELPNGTVIYNTGDTAVFGDMKLIAELYRPTVLMLPIGDFYTMGPRQAAKACELVDPEWIIPQHYGSFDGLPGKPEALRERLPAPMRNRLLTPQPGETIR